MNTLQIHEHFSCECFNQAWALLDLPERSTEETRKLMALSHASLYHWMNRGDCTSTHLSVGLWQLARIYAVVGSPLEAMRYATDCLEVSESNLLSPFCVAYAHEAMSRAALADDQLELAKSHIQHATEHAEGVTDKEDKKLLESDLSELRERLA